MIANFFMIVFVLKSVAGLSSNTLSAFYVFA